MKVYRVECIGGETRHFCFKEAAEQYVYKMRLCNDQGGSIQYNLIEVLIDDRAADEVEPLFSNHAVKNVFEAEVVMHKGLIKSTKVTKSADLIDPEVEGHVLTHVTFPWLANGVKSIVQSTLSAEHAVSVAKEHAASQYSELKDKGLIK